jgi:NADH dehydrogenase
MVVVAGSTGVLGFEICRRLRERGQTVRALVRATSNPDKVTALKTLGCNIAVGDLRDRSSLNAVCAGAEVAISTVTAITTAQQGESFVTTDAAGNVNLIDAAAAAGVQQFIFISFDTDGFPDAPLVEAKRVAEDHLKQSGMVYTILQPALFMESWLGPMLFADTSAATARVYGSRDVRFRYIAVADVAEFAVQCVGHPAARNAVIPLGGPEALTQREAVTYFEKAFATPFTVTEVPEDALEAQWKSAPDPFARSFSALMLGVARGCASGHAVSKYDFPIRMTSVGEFAIGLRDR